VRKKEILARTLYGSFSPLRPLLELQSTERLIVLAYHRINEKPGDAYQFQEDTVSATPAMFREQLAFLKRRCFVTTFSELAALISSGENIPRNTVIITFDDGYRDNYDIALPILSEFDLPAVVYVVTGNIDSGQPFWFDLLSFALANAPNGTLRVLNGRHSFEVFDNNRKLLRRTFGDLARRLSDEERLQVISEILDYSNSRAHLLEQERMVLSWSEVEELHSAGLEIGSHTVSHPFLSRLSDDQIKSELSDSRHRIESMIGSPAISLSYPTGGKEFYDDRVLKIAESCGYQFSVTYEHDALPYSDKMRFEIPRVHVELDVSQALFRANSLMPAVFLRSLPSEVA